MLKYNKHLFILLLIILFSGCAIKGSFQGIYEDKPSDIYDGQFSFSIDGTGSFVIKSSQTNDSCDGIIGSYSGIAGVTGYHNGSIEMKCTSGAELKGSWSSPHLPKNFLYGKVRGNNRTFAFSAGEHTSDVEKATTKYIDAITKNESNNNSSIKTKTLVIANESKKADYIYVTGTGFFVSNNGYIVTNQHVVNNGSNILVILNDKTKLEAKIIALDPVNDFALLKVNHSSNPMPIISTSKLKKGQGVFTLGYPLIALQGNEIKATFGNVNAMTGINGDSRMMQIDIPIQKGNSGGPLISYTGDVVGVTTASLNSLYALEVSGAIPQNVNYAMKSDYLIPILKQYINNWQQPKSKHKAEQKATVLIDELQASIVLVVVTIKN